MLCSGWSLLQAVEYSTATLPLLLATHWLAHIKSCISSSSSTFCVAWTGGSWDHSEAFCGQSESKNQSWPHSWCQLLQRHSIPGLAWHHSCVRARWGWDGGVCDQHHQPNVHWSIILTFYTSSRAQWDNIVIITLLINAMLLLEWNGTLESVKTD